MTWILLSLVLVPIAGAIIGAMIPTAAARWSALGVSLLTLGLTILLASGFNFNQDLRQWSIDDMMEGQPIRGTPARKPGVVQIRFGAGDDEMLSIRQLGFKLSLGVDAISMWLVGLTVLLTPLAIAASFSSIKQREKEYYAWMLALLGAMIGVFLARDLLLFYIFFELTLVPMFFIIGIWGGPERRTAAGKFFLFTFAGSVFTLAGVVYLGLKRGNFDLNAIQNFAQESLTDTQRMWVLLALLAGFAVKVPLFPVHTWLPLAHTEAPTAGSVILAGVLLKLGTYGLLRLALPIGLMGRDGVIFPAIVKAIAVLCIIGIIYGALVAWVQRDIKKLVAYSSVSHLGFCVLGMVALTTIGVQGSILYMINHGLSTGALFLVIGMIYDRYHTRDINELSGLSKIMPKMAFFFVFFTLASIGLPGLNGFVSEFLTVLGAFRSEHLGIGYGAFAALGVILGAIYMLHMLARVLFGPLKVPHVHAEPVAGETEMPGDTDRAVEYAHPGTAIRRMRSDHLPRDINGREVAILVPLAVCCLVLGVASAFVTRSMVGPINVLLWPAGQVQSVAEQTAPPAHVEKSS